MLHSFGFVLTVKHYKSNGTAILFSLVFPRQIFYAALQPVLELALVDQATHRDPPVSASQVLGLKACTTITWMEMQFLKRLFIEH